jgi:hypothetical protein
VLETKRASVFGCHFQRQNLSARGSVPCGRIETNLATPSALVIVLTDSDTVSSEIKGSQKFVIHSFPIYTYSQTGYIAPTTDEIRTETTPPWW